MSERTYALRQLRSFILKRGKALQRKSKLRWLSPEEVDDHVFAVKVRVDECRGIISEIDRMLEFKPTGRKKKA